MFSTVLLQMEVPDRFRGRVFAAELALVTLMSSASSYWTGHAARSRRLVAAARSPFALGAMFCVPGVLWLLIQSRWKEHREHRRRSSNASAKRKLLERRIG